MDDTDYVLGRTKAEYDRLIEQAELLRPLTERVLRGAGIAPGMHVLDIGCGEGDVSFLVRELVGVEGSVVGVDLDGDAVSFANDRRAARGITNVMFRVADARSVDSERLFDAAVGRFVLMFMSDPTAALRHIAERVRAGGIVAFHEWVAGISSASAMNQPVLASFQDLISAAFKHSGARLEIGAELYWRMRNAGLEPDPRPLAEIAMCFGGWCSWVSSLGPFCTKHAPEDRRVWPRRRERVPRHGRAPATRRAARYPRPHTVVLANGRSMGAQATNPLSRLTSQCRRRGSAARLADRRRCAAAAVGLRPLVRGPR